MLQSVNLGKEIRQKGTPIRRRERNVKETRRYILLGGIKKRKGLKQWIGSQTLAPDGDPNLVKGIFMDQDIHKG